MSDKVNTCLMDIFDELLDKLELPRDSRCYESNEFFYEKLNPQITWETELYTSISKLALRTLIEEAYIAGKKEGYETSQELVSAWIASHGTLRKVK